MVEESCCSGERCWDRLHILSHLADCCWSRGLGSQERVRRSMRLEGFPRCVLGFVKRNGAQITKSMVILGSVTVRFAARAFQVGWVHIDCHQCI